MRVPSQRSPIYLHSSLLSKERKSIHPCLGNAKVERLAILSNAWAKGLGTVVRLEASTDFKSTVQASIVVEVEEVAKAEAAKVAGSAT